MKKTGLIKCFLIAGLLWVFLAPVSHAFEIIHDVFDNSTAAVRVDRIKDNGTTAVSTTCYAEALDSYNEGVPFQEYEVVIPADQTIDASVAAADCDTLLALYCGSFDPQNPGDNLIAVDDDGAGYPHPSIDSIMLEAGTYSLVITSYSNYKACSDFIIYVDRGGCTDDDEDGFFVEQGCGDEVDCDDTNPDVYPGNGCEPTFAEEIIFSAVSANNKVTLKWTAISEQDVLGYHILRNKGGQYEQINNNLIPARGSIETTADYEYIDEDVQNKKLYKYILKEVETDDDAKEYGPVQARPRMIYGVLER